MPIVDRIDDAELADLEDVVTNAEEQGAPDPELYRVLGHNPELARTFADHWTATFYEGALDHELKEIVRIRVNRIHGCPYCSVVRSNVAADRGLTAEKIEAIDDYEDDDRFTERERAALRFGDAFVENEHEYGELKEHFDDAEIVELAWHVGLCDGLGKAVASFGITACELDAAELLGAEPTR